MHHTKINRKAKKTDKILQIFKVYMPLSQQQPVYL